MDIQSFIDSLPNNKKIEGLEGKNSTFHFDFAEGGHFTVRIADGVLNVDSGQHGEANCTVSTTPEHFSNLVKGELNPMMAMMTGKIKISNPMEMMQYAKHFGLA